ncbi:DUF4365 domain-containing protein [Halomonas sp. GFAJ-1]|uniref:DUF4365 domain-containing protein n=1 Tax=Halomonas sp. GFAJ-1 TaxID=1118153 RepID=UPI00023A1B54|nr:DUF4365 domain-containing protein [Halomonas sp. GFAJ-1]AVI63229.1 hypothetical protein BB497_11235 [Halomonas sp. GFAJ-1]EHK60680.1 hypothetical protein MOY_10465 [Halomonas sp. GFAJ-1]
MSDRKGGKQSQLTGERAETKVRDALLDAELFCSKYEHDRGEDLLVELEGYIGQSDVGSGPRIGLLQIKGHEAESALAFGESVAKRRLELNHLRRWAAIPLPVFVVAVELVGNTPVFFANSVDKLVGEVAPDGLAALEQKKVTISLPRIDELPSFLRSEIAEFYSLHAFQLSDVSENVIARNHYEIISTKKPFVLPQANVWQKHIRVLWKGPWRPAHFWATLNHIADQLQEKDGGRRVPLLATVHVYRSLKDDRDNNAIAHASWLEDKHPAADQLRERINWPRAAHWARFQFHGKSALEERPESVSMEEDDDTFIAKAEEIFEQLDSICLDIMNSLTTDLRLPEQKLERLERLLHKLDDTVIQELGRPSPQFTVLERMIDQYSFVLSGVFAWLKGKEDVPEVRRKRWLGQDLEMAQGYYRAYHPMAKLLLDR